MSSLQYTPYDPTALIAGDFPVRSRTITIASGANAAGVPLPRGTLLGRVTASDKYIPCVKTASDGSQVPAAIVAPVEGVDAGSADAVAPAYVCGEFAFEEMVVDVSWSLTTLQAAVRQAASVIFIRSVGLVA